jgi:hypothetical protein
MSSVHIKFGRGNHAILTHQDVWKPGDQPPEDHDYLGWREWDKVQHKAGLRQQQCGKCGLWKYPQELSAEYQRWTATTRGGSKYKVVEPLCVGCAPISTSASREEK